MAKVKVRFLRDMPGATYGNWNLMAGDVIELDSHQAEDVTRQGFAELVRPSKRRGGAKAEAAVAEAPRKR